MTSGYIRVPDPRTYAGESFEERERLYTALKLLLCDYAMTELSRPS